MSCRNETMGRGLSPFSWGRGRLERMMPTTKKGTVPLLACVLAALAIAGCGGSRLKTVPVEGKLAYKGEALKFGSVLFQPEHGPPARGEIQPDGTFRLSTFGTNDGAVLGTHRVQIACNESQDPNAPPPNPDVEVARGESLIPEKYSNYATSGITFEVEDEGTQRFDRDLSD